jgi:hypothetical protein
VATFTPDPPRAPIHEHDGAYRNAAPPSPDRGNTIHRPQGRATGREKKPSSIDRAQPLEGQERRGYELAESKFKEGRGACDAASGGALWRDEAAADAKKSGAVVR